MRHSDFVAWALRGDTSSFYSDLRWTGWEDESAALDLDQGISVFPPLFSQEAKNDLAAATRAPVPMSELLDLNNDLAWQLRHVPDGGTFRIAVEDSTPKAQRRFWKR
jgi:hypothetical protein